ncbi:MAG: acetyl-CoA C-acetyltransferase [Bacteroidota bacterium]
MAQAYIYDAVRTPRGRGKAGGALHEIKPIDLLGACLRAIQLRNKLNIDQVDDMVIGCVTPVNNQGHNIAKAALLYANWPESIGGFQINRFGASGLEAVNLAAMKITSGWEELVLAGGVESMSRTPMYQDGGALLFDPDVINKTGYIPHGVAADLIASLENFTGEELDEFAVQSHKRAKTAWTNEYFKNSIIPIFDKNGLVVLDKDEVIRPDTSIEALASLTPSFANLGQSGFDEIALQKYPQIERIDYLHTAGNSSEIVDGASLVLVGSEKIGQQENIKPRAKITSVANISSATTAMLNGAVPAAQLVLKRANMSVTDIDLWEVNEAFSSVVLNFQKSLNISSDILNVNGGAIAMGHPLGATGAMLIGTLLDELERRALSTGLVAVSASGGMGVATIIERL